jgi:hypothetical protein
MAALKRWVAEKFDKGTYDDTKDKEALAKLTTAMQEKNKRAELKTHNRQQIANAYANKMKHIAAGKQCTETQAEKEKSAQALIEALARADRDDQKVEEVKLEQFFRAHLKKKGAKGQAKKKKQYHIANKVLSLVAEKKASAKTFYCVRCRARTTSATAPQRTKTRNGQPMLRGKCRRCGCKVVKFVSKRA